jgi:hypothetical protein
VCNASTWSIQPWAQGTSCTDIGEEYVDPQCNQSTYVCNGSGTCVAQPTNEGLPCNDGNDCTAGEKCVSGTCGSPSSSVSCSALDTCHTIGSSVPSTGVCTNPAKQSGSSCNDGSSCTTNDACDANAACVGAMTCAAGPITSPATNTTGSYTVSWPVAAPVVDHYVLTENGLSVYSGSATSYAVSNRNEGTYKYVVQAFNGAGSSPASTEQDTTVYLVPSTPTGFHAPANTGASYSLSWDPVSNLGVSYQVDELVQGGSWTLSQTVTPPRASYAGRSVGSYFYRLRACNPAGCSPNTAQVSVQVISALPSNIPNGTNASVSDPGNQFVGAMPGTPSVDGGAAGYHVPIEIPPGRAAMQPEVSLSYNSRNGNGVAGVGWTLSAGSAITRCAKTVAQDGHARPVQQEPQDALCLDGQRLFLTPGSGGSYGYWGIYHTEIETYQTITQLGDPINQWGSYFQVKDKSGRISFYYNFSLETENKVVPDAWFLTTVFDPQGNCIMYNWDVRNLRYIPHTTNVPEDVEYVLSSIDYTGYSSTPGRVCSNAGRHVSFTYIDRVDQRTTYQYGVGSVAGSLLTGISTSLGSGTSATSVRYYQLGHHLSIATRRNLLDTLTVCAGSTCASGTPALPPTTFSYGESSPSFLSAGPLTNPFSDHSYTWTINPIGDLDGDGTRDFVYVQQGTGNKLYSLSSCGTTVPIHPNTATSLTVSDVLYATDADYDGRADIVGIDLNSTLQLYTARCSGVSSSASTNYAFPVYANGADATPDNTYAGLIDYDGDGIEDLAYIGPDGAAWLVLRNGPALSSFAGTRSRTPQPYNNYIASLTQDLNGDGKIDMVLDDSREFGTDQSNVQFFLDPASNQIAFTALAMTPDISADPFVGHFSGSHRNARWMDINGDGLPDIYAPPYVWINRGGAVRDPANNNAPKPIFELHAVALPNSPSFGQNSRWAIVMDFDSDGRAELLVPTTRATDAQGGRYCNQSTTQKDSDGKFIILCGDDFDGDPQDWDNDMSVFNWEAYRFQENADGSYSLVGAPSGAGWPTNLLAPRSKIPLVQADLHGQGMTDVAFTLPKPIQIPNGFMSYWDGIDPSLLAGPVVELNNGYAIDLMTVATKYNTENSNTGTVATWNHRPISQSGPVSGCGNQSLPFYVEHLDDNQRSPGYAYFASSMYAIASFDVSNGVGSGMNRTCYRYEDGMLNEQGRGFQGFKVIHAEEQMGVGSGETAAPSWLTCGDGGPCSANNLATTTRFYQEFPLTSRVQEIDVQTQVAAVTQTKAAPSGGGVQQPRLSETFYYWDVRNMPSGAIAVSSVGQVEYHHDPSGTDATQPIYVSRTISVSQIDPVSGELSTSCKFAPGPVLGQTQTLYTLQNRALKNSVWLGEVLSVYSE